MKNIYEVQLNNAVRKSFISLQAMRDYNDEKGGIEILTEAIEYFVSITKEVEK